MSETGPPRVLFCAFAELPGHTGTSARTQQWLSVLGNKSTDALCVKGDRDPHIQRLGGARVMRVPGVTGKPFAERLHTYQRALARQLSGDSYDLVWCADLASAAVLAQGGHRGPVLVEARGSVVSRLDGDAQKRQRDGERAMLRSATRVLVSSRAAARHLAARTDPKNILVIPGCVDRSVFAPPSMELMLDDEQRVVVFGGREGGARLDLVVALLARLAPRVAPTVRLSLLGAPGPADDDVRAALKRAGLVGGSRPGAVELVDADSPHAVSAALAGAHVVVVPGSAGSETEPPALPQRALEAMACGRAVVLGMPVAFAAEALGEPSACAETVPLDVEPLADAVLALLGQELRRQALGRAAAHLVEISCDLASRGADAAALIREATGVALVSHEPRDDDGDTSSRSAPGAAHARRATARPPATVAAAAAPAAQPSSSSLPSQPSMPPGLSASSMSAMQTLRMDAPAFSHLDAPGGMWEGDTLLDSGAPPHTDTHVDAERVKAAMLVSSDASRAARRAAASEASSEHALTSLKVTSELGSLDGAASDAGDVWVNDTIADGTPVDPVRPASLEKPTRPEKSEPRPAARSLLVERDQRPDLTAEDLIDASASDSSDSDTPFIPPR